MKLLRLPSNRSFILSQGIGDKPATLSLLPLIFEEYSSNQYYTACHHYKAVEFYANKDIQTYTNNQQFSLKPIIKEEFLKKIEGIDLYTSKDNQELLCVISDKFGDLHKLSVQKADQKSDHNGVYLNSNLGIPKYIKYCSFNEKEYYILGDEEKRIKVYNAGNPHQILSIWHIINMHSVQLLFFGEKILLLMKYFDQVSLKQDIELHWFYKGQLEEEDYPGKNIQKNIAFEKNLCKFYTLVKLSEKRAILLVLTEKTIQYESFFIDQQKGFVSQGSSKKIEIQEGKWDFLDLISVSNKDSEELLIAYGQQVQVNSEISDKAFQINQDLFKKSLNQYEKMIKIKL